MKTKVYEPKYQCWVEKDFLADRAVMRMTPCQRHLYRALLQAAFNVDTRPYLPVDDEQLCQIADADSMEQWQTNKATVLAKFQHFTADDGTELWSHKRILSDWGLVMDYVEKKRKAGQARQQKGAGAEQVGTPARKPKVLKESESEKEMETKAETEPASAFGSVKESNPSSLDTPLLLGTDGSVGAVSRSQQEALQAIGATWSLLYSSPADAADLKGIVEDFFNGDAAAAKVEMQSLLIWAANTSNYWCPKKKVLKSAEILRHRFGEVHRQWSLYTEKQRAGVEEKQFMDEFRASTRKSTPEAPGEPDPEFGNEDMDFGDFEINEADLED